MSTVAVMQPYFFPYAGYYRLLAAADIFVMFDCVQFPRRGWVHRNRMPRADGALDWLTLPLKKADVDVLIRALEFIDSPGPEALARFRAFPSLKAALAGGPGAAPDGFAAVTDFSGSVVDYLERTLRWTAGLLGLHPEFRRSSSFAIDPALRGQERVIALARANGARRYVNLAGGIDLYDPAVFEQHGIGLKLLKPYSGNSVSILHRLVTEDHQAIRRDILSNVRFQE